MTLDPYYRERFVGIGDVTWEAVYGGAALTTAPAASETGKHGDQHR